MPTKVSKSDVDYEDIQNILIDPLSNREVMIPFTGKAFMTGTLQPPRVSREHRNKDSRESIPMKEKEEEVVVRIGADIFIPMTRSEALLWLDNRRKDSNNRKADETDTSHLQSNREFPVQLSIGQQIDSGNSNRDETTISSEARDFFDIREEYDENGLPIRAEAINVAKELKYLETGHNDNNYHEVGDRSLRRTSWNTNASNFTIKAESHHLDKDVSVNTEEAFSRLSLRLDELARLEDEMENKKQEIQPLKSQSRLGTGWKKGFLTQQSSKSMTISQKSKDVANNNKTMSKKKVGFGTTDIREIPRVGEKSIPSRTSFMSSLSSKLVPNNIQDEKFVTQPENSATFKELNISSGTREVISEQVFSGSILERKSTLEDKSQNTRSNKPERKLSRFAQERLKKYDEETKSK
jgi:hypothetical protein